MQLALGLSSGSLEKHSTKNGVLCPVGEHCIQCIVGLAIWAIEANIDTLGCSG